MSWVKYTERGGATGGAPGFGVPHDERHVADALVAVPSRHLQLDLQLLWPRITVSNRCKLRGKVEAGWWGAVAPNAADRTVFGSGVQHVQSLFAIALTMSLEHDAKRRPCVTSYHVRMRDAVAPS